jgi:casein kinase 1
MYLLRSCLPWQNLKASNKKDKYERIMEKKISTPIEVLCRGYPDEFSKYLSYCRNLKFDEKPDYEFCKNLYSECFTRHGFENDNVYEWNIVSK